VQASIPHWHTLLSKAPLVGLGIASWETGLHLDRRLSVVSRETYNAGRSVVDKASRGFVRLNRSVWGELTEESSTYRSAGVIHDALLEVTLVRRTALGRRSLKTLVRRY